MLSPFFLWPPVPTEPRSLGLRIAATTILLASLAAGAAALWRDLRFAYQNAGPSAFTDLDRRQMAAVRQSVPEGAAILLIATSTNGWYARLWQRGLYPSQQGVVVLEPHEPDAIRKLRERYGIRHAVLIGPPPFDPGLLWRRDLGPLAGMPGRVWFGELLP